MTGTIVLFGLGLIFALFIVVKGLRIIGQAEVMLIERLGKFNKMLTSGPNVIIPIIDRPRSILWRYTIQDPRKPGRNLYVTKSNERIDLREIV